MMSGDDWTFWLIIENFAIGIITLLAVLVVQRRLLTFQS
jgi:hypothetical protein